MEAVSQSYCPLKCDSLGQIRMSSTDVEIPVLDTRSPEVPRASAAAPATMEERVSTSARPAPDQERAARIWQIIQGWNNKPGRPQFEKVALTASTLEKRFGIFRPAAEQFIAEHQAEIAAHAQAHAITALAHNRGIPEQVWEILKQRSAKVET